MRAPLPRPAVDGLAKRCVRRRLECPRRDIGHTAAAVAPVEIRGLTKRFGSVTAVDDLSFEIRAGRVTGFLGPNGAGKSTTLRTLLGLIHPSAGEATFGGLPYERLVRPTTKVGAVLEDTAFHPGRTGRNHLRVLAITGEHAPQRVDEVLEEVGLTDAANRRVGGYSLGMRQRLAIAAALLGDPEVLILDEPANGLDPPGISWMRTMLREQSARGRAVLVSSHLLAEVAQTVDDVVVISRGQLRGKGTLEEVLGGSGDPVTEVRARDADGLEQALRASGNRVDRDGERLVVPGATPEAVGLVAAEAGIALMGLVPRVRSLEDAFFELTGSTE